MEKLFLVDAYALIFKFYYAFISRPMRNSEGLNTSAIFGFTKFINDIITKERPKYLGVAFDPKGGNFRHQLYPQYKANRSETPEDIILSTPHIKRILEAMKIPILEVAGYEADDVIGTISSRAACRGFEVFMVTPDKDYGQLIQDCVYMYKPSKSGMGVEIVNKEQILQQYGGIDDPLQIIDILALWGDSADNIPGVPGIGEKTASKLVKEYGGVEAIIENCHNLKGKQKDNICEYTERLRLARRLAEIDRNVPIEFSPSNLLLESPDYEVLRKIYIEMGFSSLLRDLDFWKKADGGDISMIMQTDLFGNVEPEIKKTTNKQPESLSLFDIIEETPLCQNIENTPHNYIILQTKQDIEQLCSALMMCGEFCFDTETTGLEPRRSALVGISISTEAHKAYYIPLDPNDKEATKEILAPLVPLFASNKIAKIGQNIKFDILMLREYGIEVNGFLYDTMIMHYLIDSDSRHGMNYLSQKYLNYLPVEIESLIGRGAKQLSMSSVPLNKIAEYAAEDADVTIQLKDKLWKEIKSSGLVSLYSDIEEPLIKVLAEMEYNGVKIDCPSLAKYQVELDKELKSIEEQISQISGTNNLNINSPKQLGELLFEKLKIENNPKKTKTKQYRTDEEYLVSLKSKHEIIDMILEYRGLKKLLSTYIEALPAIVNPITGRIHTTYNQALTTTGRLSSNNPNLQNIPIRDERGKYIRSAFMATDDDHSIISADYSQVELRVMAHLSGDKSLIEAFNNKEDIHTATASKIFGIPIEEVTKEQRRQAKTANFGIIYGISVFGLSQRLDIPRIEAKILIDGYFQSYPQVKEYMDRSVEEAKTKGYAETIFGRKRKLADINSTNAIVRGYAERNAINAPIQGSAADIMKIAMRRVFDRLQEEGSKAKMILQVHDELVLDVPNEEVGNVRTIVEDEMMQATKLKVDLLAESGCANNWLDAH